MKNIVLIFAVICLAQGCSVFELAKKASRTPVPVKDVTLISNENANQGFPIPGDIIVVNTNDLIPVIAEMDTDTWFNQRAFILPENIGALEVISYEVIVGDYEDPIRFDWTDRKDARAVFIFANYIDSDVGKVRVDKIPSPIIYLGQSNISVRS